MDRQVCISRLNNNNNNTLHLSISNCPLSLCMCIHTHIYIYKDVGGDGQVAGRYVDVILANHALPYRVFALHLVSDLFAHVLLPLPLCKIVS